MANKSIRDLRRKKLREKKRKRRKNLIKIGFCALIIVGALKIDFRKKTDDIKIRKPIENRYAQANKKEEKKEEKTGAIQVATAIGFEDLKIKDDQKLDNDGYSDVMKSYVKSLKSQYCYQEPSDYSKTSVSIGNDQYIEYYGTENSFSKIKINDDFYYVNKFGLRKLNSDNENIDVIKGIVFVNKENPLPKDFNPGLDPTSKKAFNTMLIEMNREGLNVKIASDFRKGESEEKLLDQDNPDADDPFTSEHQTGTSFDFFTDDTKYSNKFKDTEEYKWLKDNAYKYGFIERYKKEKESITGKNKDHGILGM
ncbi:serine-type D-Ala-D-Ala carboxypeptidase [Anaerococcus hydrogenalis DSM 7454]|uniref:Serine-type D-Ala-D-Ala carboxypeptidase n=1 Tax=Anaerococcus hydrogenalis DSM 7454 TaxID=561177 RepID=B6WBT5_9FIRM|nr:M15 family metallopeptidase [Anaerococcus hydrogenalis]EEB35104.1 serine-type D-Ala-D-Ala carboxypeptidase [Anaerococcus hydrogenalis DSM 7454]